MKHNGSLGKDGHKIIILHQVRYPRPRKKHAAHFHSCVVSSSKSAYTIWSNHRNQESINGIWLEVRGCGFRWESQDTATMKWKMNEK